MRTAWWLAALALAPMTLCAQNAETAGSAASVSAVAGADSAAPFGPPVGDEQIYAHARLDQLEYRAAGSNSLSRWQGEGWMGTDSNRLLIGSEGAVDRRGRVRDGQDELLYERPLTSFFNWQAGARYDLDSAPGRAWAALGVEGLAPYQLQVSATLFASDAGHFAARAEGSWDWLLTQRLILQPQAELNAYSEADPRREVGSGLANLDAGLRLRYEIVRQFAPYLGVSYERLYAQSARYARSADEPTGTFSVLLGVRCWL